MSIDAEALAGVQPGDTMSDSTLVEKRAFVQQHEEMMATVPSYAAAWRAQEESFTPTLSSAIRSIRDYLRGYDDATAECATDISERTLANDIARGERDVIDAACALVTGAAADPWGYDYDVHTDTLDAAVRHLTALRTLANAVRQGGEQ
jgi:hypothetical protein